MSREHNSLAEILRAGWPFYLHVPLRVKSISLTNIIMSIYGSKMAWLDCTYLVRFFNILIATWYNVCMVIVFSFDIGWLSIILVTWIALGSCYFYTALTLNCENKLIVIFVWIAHTLWLAGLIWQVRVANSSPINLRLVRNFDVDVPF